MRGKPARTVGELRLQLDVVEYVLTSKAGLTRRDIRGEEWSGHHIERRTDLAATVRRVLGHVGRRRFAMGVATFGTTIGVTAALAGLELVGVYLTSIVYLIAWACYRYAPDVVFDGDVDPKATVTRSSTPGMSEREVYRRLTIHGEREDLKQEKIEKKRKRQERQSKAQGRY